MTSKKLWQRVTSLVLSLALTATMFFSVSVSALETNSKKLNLNLSYTKSSTVASKYGSIHEKTYQTPYAPEIQTYAQIPESFDLRTSNKVTPVKNQGNWGTCWAHASMSAIESNVLMQNGGTKDLSEYQLAWFAFKPYSDGEGLENLNNNPLNQGGNTGIAIGILSAWAGATTESDIPYNNEEQAAVDSSKRFNTDIRLDDVIKLPETANFSSVENHTGYSLNTSAVTAIKQSIMDNGTVKISYFADYSLNPGVSDGTYITKDDKSHYTYEYRISNHDVSVVGWDDNYASTNFISGHQPAGNGAWIVKNSWGTSFGDNGYFYLSYYDQSVNGFTTYKADLKDNNSKFDYDNNYQYDYLNLTSSYFLNASPDACSVANIFTASSHENLTAVSVQLPANTYNNTVTTTIYKLSDKSSPVQGTPLSTQTDVYPYSGYYTQELDTPVELKAGDIFSVVQTLTTNNGTEYILPVELGDIDPRKGVDTNGQLAPNVNKATSKISEGQSFITENNTDWFDLADNVISIQGVTIGNAMIKAFTKNILDIPEDFNITYNPSKTTLADLTLPSDNDGSWAWKVPTTQLVIGTNSYKAIYTPTTDKYAPTEVDIEVTITKANATLTIGEMTGKYGQTLNDITFTTASSNISGTFSWKKPNQELVLGDNSVEYIFTPVDDTHYNIGGGKINIKVAPTTISKDNFVVAGEIAITGVGGKLNITNLATNSDEYTALNAKLSANQKILSACDLQLENVSKLGKITVTLPVSDNTLNNKTVSVLHYLTPGQIDKTGFIIDFATVDVYDSVTVKDGVVTIEAYSLSPFAIVYTEVKNPDVPSPDNKPIVDPTPSPETAEINNNKNNIAIATIIVILISVCGLYMVKEKKSKFDI